MFKAIRQFKFPTCLFYSQPQAYSQAPLAARTPAANRLTPYRSIHRGTGILPDMTAKAVFDDVAGNAIVDKLEALSHVRWKLR